jgi:Na+/H+ antiporter NhaD/arsenite permease-like protein
MIPGSDLRFPRSFAKSAIATLLFVFASNTAAAETSSMNLHLTHHPIGWIALVLFVLAFAAVTLTAGVGGSLLSIGSAAGVALRGASRGLYTFTSHLRWSPAIALGYVASVLCQYWLNAVLVHR